MSIKHVRRVPSALSENARSKLWDLPICSTNSLKFYYRIGAFRFLIHKSLDENVKNKGFRKCKNRATTRTVTFRPVVVFFAMRRSFAMAKVRTFILVYLKQATAQLLLHFEQHDFSNVNILITRGSHKTCFPPTINRLLHQRKTFWRSLKLARSVRYFEIRPSLVRDTNRTNFIKTIFFPS